MNEYIYNHIAPRLDRIDAQLKKIESERKNIPQLEIEICSINCDELIKQLQKIIGSFAGGCNVKITVKLKELAE